MEEAKQSIQDNNTPFSDLITVTSSSYVSNIQVTENLDAIYKTEPSNLEPEYITLQAVSVGKTW